MYIVKIIKFLPKEYQKKAIIFIIFLTIATFLETLSIGIIFPLIELAINGNFSKNLFSLGFEKFLNFEDDLLLIKYLISIIIFLYFFKTIYLLFFNYWQLKFSQNIFKSLSCDLLGNYMTNSIHFHYKKNSSELTRNTLLECKNFGYLISIILKLIVESMIVIFLFLLVLYIEPITTLILTSSLTILVLIYYAVTKNLIYRLGVERVEATGKQMKVLNEAFSGIKDIKLKSSENFFLNLYEKFTDKFIKSAYKQQWIIESPRVVFEFIFIFILLISLLFYTNYNSSIKSLIPILSLYVITGLRIIPSTMKILSIFQQIKGHTATIDILQNEFKNIVAKRNNEIIKKKYFVFKKEINISNVDFSYEGRKDIFNNFSTIIKKNSCIGIIGKSGSGKSTMIDLITGLISPTKGKVLVDGVDIKENPNGWQSKIGYVSQSVFLLDGSIKENVAFGAEVKNIDEKLVKKSLEDAKILDFVNELEDGINTAVGEKGVQISGGQRQRIAIARELYRKPELLILDEATSALDEKTENQFLQFVDNLKNKLTIIIVSHRKNTLKNCEKILEL